MTAIPVPVRGHLTAVLACRHGMTPERAGRAVHSPEPDADLAWHEFILSTRDYAAYCELIGGFIHHVPSGTSCGGVSCTNGDCTSGGPPHDLTGEPE